MAKEQNKNTVSDLPKYIKDLLVETPSAITKLCALWDGLTAETQVKILLEIKAGRYSCYFTDKIYVKAVKSHNPYVRYLGAKNLSFGESSSDEVNAVERLIKEDTNNLVKYSLYENECRFLPPSAMKDNPLEPDTFFKLPHQARLAVVRSLSGCGKDIVEVVRYAIDNCLKNDTLAEDELFDILLDYLNKPEFRSHYETERYSYDGYGEYLKGKDVATLWGLVTKVPKSCSYVLIKFLPVSAGLSNNIPGNIVNKLDNWQLENLLDRDDIELQELRKKIFWEYVDYNQEEKDNDKSWRKSMLLGAAISHSFRLSYDDFAKILSKPEKQKIKILNELTNANDLELCIYEAIHDVMFKSNVDMFSWEYAEFAKYPFERRLKKLKDYQLKKELLGLKLYRLANQVMPWKGKRYELTEKLEFLKEHVVEGDTWKTFIAFSDAWPKKNFKELYKHLPGIDEVESDSSEDKDSILNYEKMKIMFALELSSLKSEIGRIKFLMYAVIALIIILLISK
ncbi:MAG: hypothetical protein FVQ85_17790 [Planctomycetes bacterium]|nr:hypothetical protein [Planctomycetota bacterium]